MAIARECGASDSLSTVWCPEAAFAGSSDEVGKRCLGAYRRLLGATGRIYPLQKALCRVLAAGSPGRHPCGLGAATRGNGIPCGKRGRCALAPPTALTSPSLRRPA